MEQLQKTLKTLHSNTIKLCLDAFGRTFTNSGNYGFFCHSEEEYRGLSKLASELTLESEEENRKYFELKEPLKVVSEDGVKQNYNFLYIRKPDPTPYGLFLGDIDFYLGDDEYMELLEKARLGKKPNVELYDQEGVGTMIQLSNDATRSLAYISTKTMVEKVRFRW